MKSIPRACTLTLALALLPWMASSSSALTIYRIGGSSLPPPEREGGVGFVQLEWEEVDPNQHGQVELLEVSADLLEPEQLNPSVNLTPTFRNRGGRISHLGWGGWIANPLQEDENLWDEDPETVVLGDGHWTLTGIGQDTKSLIFEFSGNFTVERIRFFPREQHRGDRFLQHFLIGISDGDPLKDGTREHTTADTPFFDFDIVHEATANTESLVEIDLPPVPIRSLLFEAHENTQGIWEIAEFEIYGKGFTPTASYASNVIDLGGLAALGELSWSAELDPGARIDLSMRAGDDADPNNYWRKTFRGDEKTRLDTRGRLLTGRNYSRLEKAQQAGITPDTENWEGWSTPYDLAAERAPMQGDKPRQFVQLRADFHSTVEAGGRLRSVQFAVSQPPLARLVRAEITPRLAPVGEAGEFTYLLLPQMEDGDLGFDTIEIDTPTAAVEGIDAVRFSGDDVAFEVKRRDADGFAIEIPRVDESRDGELIEVVFRAQIFSFGTVFSGRVYDSARPLEVPQVVTEGEVDELVEGNTLRVSGYRR